MQDNKLGAYSIFKALKHQFDNCHADEMIGMKEMLKYHWYLLRNNPQRNIESENEELRRENAKLLLKVDDLENDLETLKRLKK